ncbi:hypothetical protein [Kitasatospora acidiphila]|uniref:hypothetical protein n=1 Tax=Kitasatospora acidiphila TaxID=2567942 RepID=UPI003C73ACEE
MRHDGELVPRPEKSPAALKAALSVVAADRLPELVNDQTRAVAEALKGGTINPLRSFVARWAAVVEIERVPQSAAAYHRANYLASHAETVEECRTNAAEVATIYRVVYTAVNE